MFFALRQLEHGRWQVLAVTGEVDLSAAPQFRTELQAMYRTGKPVMVDLSNCDFIDSIGLGLLVGAARRMAEAGHGFAVIASDEPVRGLLRRSRIDEIVDVYATVGETPP